MATEIISLHKYKVLHRENGLSYYDKLCKRFGPEIDNARMSGIWQESTNWLEVGNKN